MIEKPKLDSVFEFLYKESILSKELKLIDWFEKSVKTCPYKIGRTVRWDIHCFECGAKLIEETDNWGGMKDKIYSDIICLECLKKNIINIHYKNIEIPQYEI